MLILYIKSNIYRLNIQKSKMRNIEKELEKYKSRVIEHSTISSILKNLGYKKINDKIVWLKNKDILIPLKNSYYIYNSLYNELISLEIISNTLLGPSYISLDYALWFYGLIPESVYEITAITTKRAKSFKNTYGTFSYKYIKKELFNIGLEIKNNKNGNFIIATKEKAVCDKVYFTKNIDIRSQNSIIRFLEDDLRVDIDELKDCNINILKEYLQVSKSKKIDTLIKVIQGLNK